jgi:hypothetical protein
LGLLRVRGPTGGRAGTVLLGSVAERIERAGRRDPAPEEDDMSSSVPSGMAVARAGDMLKCGARRGGRGGEGGGELGGELDCKAILRSTSDARSSSRSEKPNPNASRMEGTGDAERDGPREATWE